MSEQIAVRIPDDLAEDLERLVASGDFGSKAEAIRQALRRFVEEVRRRQIGEQIAEGYRRIPQTDEELESARAAAIRSIEEEPW